jgi:hypothetical protein
VDQLTRDLLTRIQGGESSFQPKDRSRESLLEFQAAVKRIEWAKRQGYIKDTRSLTCTYVDRPDLTLAINVVGGLTLDGQRALLEDPDQRAF